MMAKKLSSNTFTSAKIYKSVKIHFYISSRATLKEALTATYDCVLPRTPLVRPNPKLTPLSEKDEHPSPFKMGVLPPGGLFVFILVLRSDEERVPPKRLVRILNPRGQI